MTQRELTQADYIAILRRRWVLITVSRRSWGTVGLRRLAGASESLQVANPRAHRAAHSANGLCENP
jgi:hypothetical protein